MRQPTPPTSIRSRGSLDYAGLIACASAACCVLALSWHKIESLDTGYHLAYGKHFLDHGRIVERDPFLLPQNAEPFVNANWGSQIVMAIAHRAAGPSGLIAVRTLLLVIVFTGIAVVLRRYTTSLSWLAAAWLLAGIAGYERFSLRPELFSYAIMLVMLTLLSRLTLHRRHVVLIALLQLLWVNLHSYFLIGLFLTGALIAGELLVTQNGDRPQRLRAFGIALAAQVVACFMNPWGWRGAIFPIQTLSYLRRANAMGGGPESPSASAWSLISEFHSPFRYVGELINARTMHAYYVLLVIAAIGIVACIVRRRLGTMLLLILLMAMSFQMRRNIAQFALAGAPLAMGAITALMTIRSQTPKWLRLLPPTLVTLASIWWTVGLVNGRFYYAERRITRQFGTDYSQRTFTTDAVKWLAAHQDLQPNLFVDYFSSSNTLPWLPGRFKLFVDTNTFAYKEETLAAAFDLGLGKRAHADIFDHEEINVALLHSGPDTQPLIMRLVADYTNWALVYFDRQAVIFIRRIPEHIEIIKANHPTAANLDPRGWIDSYAEPNFTKALSLGTAVNIPLALGWHAQAADLMREAVRLAPDYHDAWYFLAVCEANLGNASARVQMMSDARFHFGKAENAVYRAKELAPPNVQYRKLWDDMNAVLKSMPK